MNLIVSTLYEPYTDGWQESQPEAEASHAHRHRCRNQPHPNQHVVGEVGNNNFGHHCRSPRASSSSSSSWFRFNAKQKIMYLGK